MLGHDSGLKFKTDNVGIRLDKSSEMKKMAAMGQAPPHPSHLGSLPGPKTQACTSWLAEISC